MCPSYVIASCLNSRHRASSSCLSVPRSAAPVSPCGWPISIASEFAQFSHLDDDEGPASAWYSSLIAAVLPLGKYSEHFGGVQSISAAPGIVLLLQIPECFDRFNDQHFQFIVTHATTPDQARPLQPYACTSHTKPIALLSVPWRSSHRTARGRPL